jgi:hypothetical protein
MGYLLAYFILLIVRLSGTAHPTRLQYGSDTRQLRDEIQEHGCGSTSFSDPSKDIYFRFRLIGLYCEEEDFTGGLQYAVSLSSLPCILQKNSAISGQGVPSNNQR